MRCGLTPAGKDADVDARNEEQRTRCHRAYPRYSRRRKIKLSVQLLFRETTQIYKMHVPVRFVRWRSGLDVFKHNLDLL